MKARVTIVILLILCVAGGVWFFIEKRTTLSPRIEGASAPTESDYVIPPFNETYTNNTYRFSVSLPEGFKAQEFEEGEGNTILLQDTSGNGIQILVTPYPDQKILTIEDVRGSIPDMEVREEQVVEVGDDYRGVAFRSNNDAFGGDSREVWFFFHGNLYQISTYGRLDALLQSMFSTWKFF